MATRCSFAIEPEEDCERAAAVRSLRGRGRAARQRRKAARGSSDSRIIAGRARAQNYSAERWSLA